MLNMNTNLESTINLGSVVEVLGTDITARVTAILLEESGIQYRINYWHDNVRRNDWVSFEELAVIKAGVV